MSLNIKNTEAYDLARELARLTGHSMTTVVLEALRKQRELLLRQQQKDGRVQEFDGDCKTPCSAYRPARERAGSWRYAL